MQTPHLPPGGHTTTTPQHAQQFLLHGLSHCSPQPEARLGTDLSTCQKRVLGHMASQYPWRPTPNTCLHQQNTRYSTGLRRAPPPDTVEATLGRQGSGPMACSGNTTGVRTTHTHTPPSTPTTTYQHKHKHTDTATTSSGSAPHRLPFPTHSTRTTSALLPTHNPLTTPPQQSGPPRGGLPFGSPWGWQPPQPLPMDPHSYAPH